MHSKSLKVLEILFVKGAFKFPVCLSKNSVLSNTLGAIFQFILFLQTRVPFILGQRALLPAEDPPNGSVPRDPHQLPGLLQTAGLHARPHLGMSPWGG